jgi:hypothetical protein
VRGHRPPDHPGVLGAPRGRAVRLGYRRGRRGDGDRGPGRLGVPGVAGGPRRCSPGRHRLMRPAWCSCAPPGSSSSRRCSQPRAPKVFPRTPHDDDRASTPSRRGIRCDILAPSSAFGSLWIDRYEKSVVADAQVPHRRRR